MSATLTDGPIQRNSRIEKGIAKDCKAIIFRAPIQALSRGINLLLFSFSCYLNLALSEMKCRVRPA